MARFYSFLPWPGVKKKECQPESYYYNLRNNAKVDTSSGGGLAALRAFVGDGNKTVFIYLHAHSPCTVIVDGFVSYRLMFEIDPLIKSFKFYDDDIKAANCYFSYETDGSTPGVYIATGGIIEGSKVNEGAWDIHFDLKIKDSQTLTGAGRFKTQ